MGILDNLGKAFGATKELDVEEYMSSEEMENVDALHEPADMYIKPVSFQQESDIDLIEDELRKRNIILLDVSEFAKRPNTLKTAVDKLKEFVNKTNGDIARIDETKLLLTPSKIKIIKRKKKPGRGER